MGLLTDPPAQQQNSGNTNPPASGGSTNPPASGGSTNPPASGGSGVPPAASWRDTLPEELKAAAPLQLINDIPTLAKSYLHAQEMVGKKGVIPPGEKATDDDWKAFFKGIGVPELDKYEIQKGEAKVSDEVVKLFKENAHKFGLLPKQAQELFNWYTKTEAQGLQAQADAKKKEQAEGIEQIKREWGQEFDTKVKGAQVAIEKIGGQELKEYLRKTGLANDPMMIRTFAQVGAIIGKEDKLRGDGSNGGGDMSKQQAQAALDAIYANQKHPALDTGHPGHRAAVAQMEQYFKILNS